MLELQSGKFEKVIKQAEALVPHFPNNKQLLTICGAANAHNKNFSNAFRWFDKIREITPMDPAVYFNMGNVERDRGNLLAAADLYAKSFEIDPKYTAAANNLNLIIHHLRSTQRFKDDHYLRACVLFLQKNYKKAILDFEKTISENPRHDDAYYKLGLSFSKAGKLKDAISTLQTAVTIDPKHALAHFALGELLFPVSKQRQASKKHLFKALELDPSLYDAHILISKLYIKDNKYTEAEAHLEKAAILAPDRVDTHYRLGMLQKKLGKFQAALKSFQLCLKMKPNFASAHAELGGLFLDAGQPEHALRALKLAIDLDPKNSSAWVNGLIAHERLNLLSDMENWLAGCYKNVTENLSDVIIFEAILRLRQKKPKLAKQSLDKIAPDKLSLNRRRRYFEILGKTEDNLENYTGAYAAYQSMNEAIQQDPAFLAAERDVYFEHAKNRLQLLSEAPVKNFLSSHVDMGNEPVFLIGFPRSGTTLLDTILRTHLAIDVAEEIPAVSHAKASLGKDKKYDFVHHFPDDKEREIARNEYVKFMATHLQNEEVSIKIDKLPLNILQLPFIHYLFPNAKIIVALRHPFDCTLSNWMQNYKINPAMANMVDLERIIKFYDICFSSLKLAKQKFSLDIHYLKYENLVDDIQRETTQLLQFLELEWDDALLEFYNTAQSRFIQTPSYSQVSQPIYTNSRYKWKNYSQFIEKYAVDIRPWLEEFGYED